MFHLQPNCGTDETKGALIATRLLIGAFEAGFFPTAVAYLSTFYTRYDLAVRIGLFYGMYAVAGAFSGSICEYISLIVQRFDIPERSR